MSQSGSIIFRRLQEVLDDARRTSLRAKREYDLLDGEMDELVSKKGATLLELARHYLPEINRPVIESTFAEIRATLLEILGRKERTQAELTTRLGRFNEATQRLETELEEITTRLNEKVRERETLEVVVADQLKTDPEFPRLTHEAAQAEARLEQNEARVKEIKQSASEKLPDYQRSALFQYLLRIRYGTVDYKARGWTRRWDKWVADLIDFPRARLGYEFLTTTPELMAKEVARRQSEFKLLMQKIEAIEDRYNDSSGLTAIREEGQKLGTRRDQVVAALATTRREQHLVEVELQQLDQNQGRFYSEAIQRFQAFLGQTESSVLQSRAQRTQDPHDDEIVSRISDLNKKIESLKPLITQSSLDRKQAEEVVNGAELVVSRFRQNNFDSERSSFSPSFDLEGSLQRFQQGLLKPEEFWQDIRRRQKFEPTASEVLATNAAHTMAHVLSDPMMSRVLVNAMVQVAGTALGAMAQSSVERRAPERQRSEIEQGRPPSSGGFTSGDGF